MIENRGRKHGYRYHSTYTVWKDMMSRCYNTKNPSYKDYGGRGIKVCEQWHNIANFITDVGEKPTGNFYFDRIDNDGNYEPNNWKWSTPRESAYNRRTNRLLTAFGKTQAFTKWATEYNISCSVIDHRITKLKMIPEEALTKPLMKPWNKKVA